MRRRLWQLLAVVAMGAISAKAAAEDDSAKRFEEKKDDLPLRKTKLEAYEGWATMTVGWRDVVDAKIRRKLLSGLPTTITARAYLFDDAAGGDPESLSVKTCKIVYDLWDEVFRIELSQAGRKRKTVAVNVEGVLRRCAQARRWPLSPMKALGKKRVYFAGVLVEVNPLSEEMLERIKRWVSRPKGAGAVGPGDSLFGSFVGLFITHVPKADRVLMFRSRRFSPAKLPVVKKKKKKKQDEDESA